MSTEPKTAREIASKAVTGSAWSLGASAITIASGFVRSVLVARLLAPQDFGAVALALVFANLANVITMFGFNAALIQYKKDSQRAASVHFIIRITLAAGTLLIALLVAPILNRFYPDRPQLVPVLLAILAFRVLGAANSTPETLLKRRLEFKRLMLLNVVSSLTMTVVTPLLAWSGWGFWSLVVGEQGVSFIVSALGLWTIRRVWTPRFRFDWRIAKHYFRFGFFVMLSRQLSFWLDQFDEFWTGTFLGDAALGFYSKAYEFAQYPRRISAQPLQDVFFATFARLQDDRLHLSKAYYRVNSLVVRVGFLFSLIFALVAHEFVTLFLGVKWLPMVLTFQLMIIYCLFDPLAVTAGRLTTAVGYPEVLTRIKALQLAVFIPSVILLARYSGIEGVAVAADLMLFLGVALLFHQLRRFVDFSLRRMFAVPLLALVLAGGVAIGVSSILALQSDWLNLFVKGGVATTVYLTISAAFEWTEYRKAIAMVLQFAGDGALEGGKA